MRILGSYLGYMASCFTYSEAIYDASVLPGFVIEEESYAIGLDLYMIGS